MKANADKQKQKTTQEAEAPYADCFVSREQSWLAFDLRCLNEAADRTVPLLDRLKFLAIYSSNLDEFFMVRIGALVHRCVFFPQYRDPKTGWGNAIELKKALQTVRHQQARVNEVFRMLREDLRQAGIEILDFSRISKVDEGMCRRLFSQAKPLLSPVVVDARHPMPFLSGREVHTAVLLGRGESAKLGLVPLGRLPGYYVFEVNGRQKVVLTEQLITRFARHLFKGYEVTDACAFRVTRNADVFLEENSGDGDLRRSMAKMLRKRKRELPVRLQLTGKPGGRLTAMLTRRVGIPERSVFHCEIPFCLSFGSGLNSREGMKYDERKSVRTVHLKKGRFFRYLERHDLLLSFPYQSMLPFVDLLYEAADDPNVLSIRITLYRLASTSQVAAALACAANQGKDVTCLLELRARFDEQNNIDYSEMLEDAGCTVLYGLKGMKVHSKLCLITRRSGSGVSYITQVGTGNYNEVTGEQYCDLSLITSAQAVGADAAKIFDALAAGTAPERTETLMTAPNGFVQQVLELLDREIAKGGEGSVSIKVNSINDMEVMKKLIECSRAGVKVELFVRGICCIRPGVPGFTDNLTVKSVVGRYLEHSRIFVFGSGADCRIFIGSGDLLNRNTRRRVEAFTEVTAPDIREQVLEVMRAFREDHEKSSLMLPDGSYIRDGISRGTSSQERLYRYFSRRTVADSGFRLPVPAFLRRLFAAVRAKK